MLTRSQLNADQTANALRFTTMVRRLAFAEDVEMLTASPQHPKNRVESIQKAVGSLKYHDNEVRCLLCAQMAWSLLTRQQFLQDFGLKMEDKLVQVRSAASSLEIYDAESFCKARGSPSQASCPQVRPVRWVSSA